MNPLSVYWSPWHRRPTDYDYFSRLQPAVVKIMDGGPPDYQWVRQHLPGALVIARDWALSEQKSDMMANPSGTGTRHAQEWAAKIAQLGFDPANTLVLGINEPPVWDAGVIPALVAYTIAFLDECGRLGLRGGALQLSVGWPGNNGEGTPPDWAPYAGVEAAIQRGKHALVLHEYWADQGPGENWGWWGGRFMKCPWQVPIIIGETGIDMYVKYGGGYQGNRGWQGHMSVYQFGAQCAEYVSRCQQDPRFFAATVFATDYQAGEWQSFDTEPARNEIVANVAGLPPAQWFHGQVPTPEPIPPTPTPEQGALIWPVTGPVTQRWGENPDFYQKRLGIPYHNGTDIGLPEGSPVIAAADGVVMMVDYDEKGYGWYCRLYCPGQRVHVFVAHMSKVIATVGQRVKKGALMGYSGNTGLSTGPHAHVETRLGTENEYAQGTFGHKNGRADPQAFFWAVGGVQEPGNVPGKTSVTHLPIVSG